MRIMRSVIMNFRSKQFQLYIIIVRPERNVRQSMMPVRYSAASKTVPSSAMAAAMVTAVTCNQNDKIEKHSPSPASDDKTIVDGTYKFFIYIFSGCNL